MRSQIWSPCLLLLAAGCAQPALDGAVARPLATITLVTKELSIGKLTYSYIVATPKACEGKTSPVLIALHGRGGTGKAAISGFELLPTAESNGFILIAPSAQNGQWHDLDKDPAQAQDFAFFTKLFDSIQSLGGDPARIYVTGFSNGGGEAFTLGANFSDRIAAIAAGGASTGALDGRLVYHSLPHPKRKIPVLIFHGMRDDINGYDMSTFTVAIPDAARWWAKQEGANLVPVHREIGKALVIENDYSGNGAQITLLSYKNLAHAWPTIEDHQTGLRFNDILWKFVSRYRLR